MREKGKEEGFGDMDVRVNESWVIRHDKTRQKQRYRTVSVTVWSRCVTARHPFLLLVVLVVLCCKS